jgi:hypothetical protein
MEVDGISMAHIHVAEAKDILQQLGLPTAQTDERSAWTLLALVDVSPEKTWRDASNPMRGITPIMEWLAQYYRDEPYKANTRETIRRQTMHQFVAAGLVVINPDEPNRPPNSPKYCYQALAELVDLLHTYGSDDWEAALEYWFTNIDQLKARWEAERQMVRIPVVLPDGTEVSISGGGQNVLIAEIVEEFCERFTPGGRVLYLGDAGDKFVVDEKAALAGLGVIIEEHGKMPDVVIWLEDRGWLVLVEAVTSHGPINALRKGDLESLFAGSTAGLVFITAFPDHRTFSRYAREIAWETDVWTADHPSHLIHYNGDRFLGPHQPVEPQTDD